MKVPERSRVEREWNKPVAEAEKLVRQALIGDLTEVFGSWQQGIVRATPEWAEAVLRRRATGQRPVRALAVYRYMRQVANDEWQTTPQGISFDRSWDLVDGQHRLCAIAASGVTVTLVVYVGLSAEVVAAMDQGVKRSVADILSRDRDIVAVTQALCGYNSTGKKIQLSPTEVADALDRYEDSIHHVALAVPKTRMVTANIRAMFAAAHIAGEPAPKLVHFLRVLATGRPSAEPIPGEMVVFLARDLLRGLDSPGHALGAPLRKLQRAIKAFCDGENITKLYDPGRWIYPLPSHPGIQDANAFADVRSFLAHLKNLRDGGSGVT